MSNRKLLEATIPENEGPIFEGVERFQDLYLESKYQHFPMKPEFISAYAAELKSFLFLRVKFYEDFVTEDGTHWLGVRVWIDKVDYRLLFPKGRDRKHEDGTVSSHHVALYYDANEPVPPEQLIQVKKTLFGVLELARRDFRH